MALLCQQQVLGNLVERGFPTQRFEFPAALAPFSTQRLRQTVGVMDTLAVAGHFAADDTGCIRIL